MLAFVASTLNEMGLQDAKVVNRFVKLVYHAYF